MGIKVTVRFREDESGIKNLGIAYETVARLLLKHINSQDHQEKKTGTEGGGGYHDSSSLHPSKQ